MDILSAWVLKFFSVHFLSVAYIATAIAFAFLYIPQIIRLARDTTGAAAISLFSSTSMMLTRTIPLLYAVAVSKDWIMAGAIFLDWTGRLVVTGVASYKRYKYSVINGVSSPEVFKEVEQTDFVDSGNEPVLDQPLR